MTLLRIAVREIRFRALNSFLSVAAIALAVGILTSTLFLFRGYDADSERAIMEKEEAVEARNAEMMDEYRKITKGMGFNILILPKGQRLADLYAEDFASKYMPEEYAQRLADAQVMSVRHLLPSLQQRIVWPEKRRTVILMGVKGQVPLLHRNPRKPIMQPVPAGSAILGHEIATDLGLTTGDKMTLKGRTFTVEQTHEARGNKDDLTVWVNLAEAQEMLDKKGLINAILALECRCVADGELPNIGKIRAELAAVLPETQVVEFMSKALTRAEARHEAVVAAKEALEQEENHRMALREERQRIAGILVPLAVVAAALIITFLTYGNTRDRRQEFGVLRAIGLRSSHLMIMLLEKALIMGFLGALVGYISAFLLSLALNRVFFGLTVFDSTALYLLIGSLIGAPILTVLAGWVPVLSAVQQDPAEVLGEE
jgi:ABC-type lipoprotein release transport system permease subunit